MKGIIAAVNHGGDSDSTGAVTGNILGGLIGFDVIDRRKMEKEVGVLGCAVGDSG